MSARRGRRCRRWHRPRDGIRAARWYYFSLSFLHRGIDSWYDVGIETALEDSLKLGRGAIDLRKRDALKKTRGIADEIAHIDSEPLIVYLDDVRQQNDAIEVTLFDHDNQIVASSNIDSTELHQRGAVVSCRQRHSSGLPSSADAPRRPRRRKRPPK